MRIRTKLALLVGFIVALSLAATVETAKASESESNQTKINFNIDESIFNAIKQPLLFGVDNSDIEIATESEEKAEENVPVVSDEVSERQGKVLSQWKEKQGRLWNNLPKSTFVVNASAYTAAADECGKSDGITASGFRVKENHTIACPPEFPFGVKIKIENMGTYTCEDRGGAIKGNKFDIYMETKAQAFAFGRKNLKAEVIE